MKGSGFRILTSVRVSVLWHGVHPWRLVNRRACVAHIPRNGAWADGGQRANSRGDYMRCYGYRHSWRGREGAHSGGVHCGVVGAPG